MAERQKLTYDGLGLPDEILKAVKRGGYREATPLQVEVIPQALEGKDVAGVAGIATGRTFTFGLPMIKRVREMHRPGLVLLPEKKVAEQVLKRFQRLSKTLELKLALLAGDDTQRQEKELAAGPDIIIGTPDVVSSWIGRGFSPSAVCAVVLDELDFILERDMKTHIEDIVAELPEDRQTFVFGKKLNEDMIVLSGAKDPLRAAAPEPEWKRKKRERRRDDDKDRSFLPARPWRGIPIEESFERSVEIAMTEIWPGERMPGMPTKTRGHRSKNRRRRRGR